MRIEETSSKLDAMIEARKKETEELESRLNSLKRTSEKLSDKAENALTEKDISVYCEASEALSNTENELGEIINRLDLLKNEPVISKDEAEEMKNTVIAEFIAQDKKVKIFAESITHDLMSLTLEYKDTTRNGEAILYKLRNNSELEIKPLRTNFAARDLLDYLSRLIESEYKAKYLQGLIAEIEEQEKKENEQERNREDPH